MRDMWTRFVDWAESGQEIARMTPMHIHTEQECMEGHQAHCSAGEDVCEKCRTLLDKVAKPERMN